MALVYFFLLLMLQESYLQYDMVDGRLPATRPLQEVVGVVLLLPEPVVPIVRVHLERPTK